MIKKIIKNYPLIPSILLGVVTGWLIYGLVNYQMYQWHYSAFKNIKAIEVIIDKEDIAMAGVMRFNAQSSQELTKIEDLTYRVSKSFGLIRKDDDYDKVSGLVKKAFNANKEMLISSEKLNEVGAHQMLIQLLTKLGAEPAYQKDDKALAEATLIRLIGKFPQGLSNFDKVLQDTSYNAIDNESYFFSYFDPFLAFSDYSNQHIIQRLLAQYRLSEKFVPLYSPAGQQTLDVSESLSIEVEYNQTKELLSRILFNLVTNEQVALTKDWLMVFRGPIQLLMFMLFFTAIFILFSRIQSNSESFEEQKSTVFLFCEETMPVLGFIGTIMGLMLALGDAYKIPIASAGTGSALAISLITNTLAMAFTTTLMAFVLKIILDLIKLLSKTKFDFITIKEEKLINKLSDKLGNKKGNE